nr:hypothetical protein [Tanacetum cinerariifolium]
GLQAAGRGHATGAAKQEDNLGVAIGAVVVLIFKCCMRQGRGLALLRFWRGTKGPLRGVRPGAGQRGHPRRRAGQVRAVSGQHAGAHREGAGGRAGAGGHEQLHPQRLHGRRLRLHPANEPAAARLGRAH